MIAKLSPELVRELEQAGDQPLPVENPQTRRVYVLVDVEQYDVVRRPPAVASDTWTENKNERRCALIRQKFSEGINAAEARELAELQNVLSTFRKRVAPLPYDVVDALQAALAPGS
jgi:hypothetical protein